MKRSLLALLLPLALALPAGADACVVSSSEVALEAAGVYVADDCAGVDPSPPNDHCMTPLGGKWIYHESNGIAGLQRDDDVRDDTCGGAVPSDTLIF